MSANGALSAIHPRQILATGALTKSDDGRAAAWLIRRLGPEDYALAAAFRAERFAELPDPDWYVPEVPDFLGWHLSGERGAVFGLFVDQTLAALTILGAPRGDWPAFAQDLPDLAATPERTAHLASTMVAPAWRRCGLQQICVELRLTLAVGMGRPHLLARVAVGNAPSWRNMLRAGLLIRRVIVMHGDKLRYLLHRDLSAPPPAFDDERRVVALEDQIALNDALADGWRGVAVTPSEMVLARLLA